MNLRHQLVWEKTKLPSKVCRVELERFQVHLHCQRVCSTVRLGAEVEESFCRMQVPDAATALVMETVWRHRNQKSKQGS